MDRADIIKAVQVRLDELSPFDDIQEVPALDHIERMLNNSCNTVFRILPYTKLPLTDMSSRGFTNGDMDGEVVMTMIPSYIKFGECKFRAWSKVVKEIADSNTEALQGSKYTMGKPSRPVVVERKVASSVKLHFFSVPSGDEEPKSLFVVTETPPELCPDLLIDAIAWQCASDVLMSIGKTEAAKLAQQKVLTHV